MRPSLPVVSDSGERVRAKKGAEQEVKAGVISCEGGSRRVGQSESKLGV